MDVARDGQEAPRKRGETPAQAPHIVMPNLMLPRVDGVNVLRRFSRAGARGPVIARSASREALAAATRAGERAARPMPVDLEALA